MYMKGQTMRKKIGILWGFLVICVVLTSCTVPFGSKHTADPAQYGKWASHLDVPPFLPTAIDNYQVNGYSYTLDAYLDDCYEIFLDITVTEDQLARLLDEAKMFPDYIGEKEAYYGDGYAEIVYEDFYVTAPQKDGAKVGWADIEKIVYNPETLNVIYVCFHANDTGVYALNAVAYFNRFSIQEEEYVENLG